MIKIADLEGFEEVKEFYFMYKRLNRVYFKNKKTKKIIKPFKKLGKMNGYMYLKLQTINGRAKNIRVHRLIATAYIPNNDINLDEVHHKDSNRTNNRIDNLEWTDRETNMFFRWNDSDDDGYLTADEMPLPEF